MKRHGLTIGGGRDQEGSVLIVALIYLCAVGVTIYGLMDFLGSSLGNVTNFGNAREEQLSATSVANFAIQSMRYTPLLSTTESANPPSYCWGSGPSSGLSGLNGYSLDAWCSTQWDPTSAATRVVTVSVCPSTTSATACAASPYLQAVVTFDDYPPGGAAAVQGPCTDWGWCGEGLTVDSWNWL